MKDILIPNTTESQQLFEEALFEWYLEKSLNHLTYACISSGTKTIPATMQQAARNFGAVDVFHVITDLPPKENPTTIDQVIEVLKVGKLQCINMGAEPGWEALKYCTSVKEFSKTLNDTSIDCLYWKLPSPNGKLSHNIRHIMQSVRVAASGKEEKMVPFSMLRLLPPEIVHWLQQPLDASTDEQWIKRLPKTELHCHLGGFATQAPLLQQVIDAAKTPTALKLKPSPTVPNGWPRPNVTISLQEYMKLGDANGSAILTDAGCLKKQVALLYEHFLEQNIRYAEVRCSPDNYTSEGRPAWVVLQDIMENFQQRMDNRFDINPETVCHVNLLIIATRKTEGDLSSISRHLALAITAVQYHSDKKLKCQVVGVDLAGYENKETRPGYFANDFLGVHRSGLAVTAHAGENDDAESVWQAVYKLHARRIGHGLQLHQAKDLMRTMADRNIGIEMCPYANYQIKGFAPMPGKEHETYQLRRYMKEGIPVSVNTDNIGISGANITDNYLLLAEMLPGITRLEILQLIRNGIETSFWTANAKNNLLKIVDQQVFAACIQCSKQI